MANHFDPFAHIWRAWNIERAGFFSFDWAKKTDIIFYPYGSNIPPGFQMDLYIPLLLFMLMKIFPLVLSWNILTLASCSLSGYSVFALIKYITRCNFSSFLCGVFFLLSTYYLDGLYQGILEQATLYFLCFCILFLLKAFNEKSKTDILLAIVFFVLSGANSVYHAILLTIFALLLYLAREGNFVRRGVVIILILISIVPVSNLLKGERQQGYPGVLFLPKKQLIDLKSVKYRQVGRVVFNVNESLANSFDYGEFFDREKILPLRSYYLGYLTAFALLALLLNFRRAKFWFFISFPFLLLASGPFFTYEGELIFPLPNIFLYWFFPFLMGIKHCRFLKIVHLCFIILAGIALSTFFRHKEISNRVKELLFICFFLLPLIQLIYIPPSIFPCKVSTLDVPLFYKTLGAKTGDIAMIEWNLFPYAGTLSGKFLYYQRYHKKKLVNSNFILWEENDKFFTWIQKNSFINLIVQAYFKNARLIRNIKTEDIESLRDSGIKYLVLHQKFEDSSQGFSDDVNNQAYSLAFVDALRNMLGKPGLFEDGIMVFSLDSIKKDRGDINLQEEWKLHKKVNPEVDRIIFYPSLQEQKIPLIADLGHFKTLSFWYKGTKDKNDPPFEFTVIRKFYGKTFILGAAKMSPEANYWHRVEIPLQEMDEEAEISGILSRPYGLAEGRVRIINMDLGSR